MLTCCPHEPTTNLAFGTFWTFRDEAQLCWNVPVGENLCIPTKRTQMTVRLEDQSLEVGS
jgi:hypothetical protein